MKTINADDNARFERVYENEGNQPLIERLSSCSQVLDVGCGAGANAILVKRKYPLSVVTGITCSNAEAEMAFGVLDDYWVFDLEDNFPDDLLKRSFDALIFSHVLEHLRDPARVVMEFVRRLQTGGQVLIAVPNVLGWRDRIRFLFGKFEYESSGVLDDTHLRFFTYYTADSFLLAQCDQLTVLEKSVTGSVPLWWFRRYLLPASWCQAIDRIGCKYWPNLFGGQVLIKAIKK